MILISRSWILVKSKFDSAEQLPSEFCGPSTKSGGVATGVEQYKNVFTQLNLFGTHDDLRTNSSASASLKKQKGKFSEIAGGYSLSYDQRNRTFAPTAGSVVTFVLFFSCWKWYHLCKECSYHSRWTVWRNLWLCYSTHPWCRRTYCNVSTPSPTCRLPNFGYWLHKFCIRLFLRKLWDPCIRYGYPWTGLDSGQRSN